MPNGLVPTYSYRPAVSGTAPQLKTRSSRRARLYAGGTYFRAKDPGGKGNNISILAVEFTPDGGQLTGKLIVTNHNTLYEENVIGPADVVYLDQDLNWNERYVIDFTQAAPRATLNSISSQIAATPVATYPFSWSALFTQPRLNVQLLPDAANLTPTSTVTIKPRVRVYDLVQKTDPAVQNPDGTQTPGASGWDIDALRVAVAADPWIEMMARAPYTAPGASTGASASAPVQAPAVANADKQDDGADAQFLTVFDEVYLTGGDGLPDTPSGERTGPDRSIVFINYGEAYDGSLININTVYEWAGDTAVAGAWQTY